MIYLEVVSLFAKAAAFVSFFLSASVSRVLAGLRLTHDLLYN